MSRRVEKDGKFFRMRRGKLVEIPLEWVGVIPSGNHYRRLWRKYCRKKENRKVRITLKIELRKELMSL